ncbi:hypothetical protein D9619_003632 [Psilocybe cf. subviscida]|uniref:non-specific serine/threonine protein kinase n=1 Tax=Psilocybe cf. subviscida TaxID=2480587 RepID=A0A8H5AXB2_9AGAR|nr:hypothetical protein D9619_003632 [Psilocybe cf. subviscida]
MAIPDSTGDTAQPDGEGDGPDKPPHAHSSSSSTITPNQLAANLDQALKFSSTNASSMSSANGNGIAHPNSYPLPPPESFPAGVKEPGLTRGALEKLERQNRQANGPITAVGPVKKALSTAAPAAAGGGPTPIITSTTKPGSNSHPSSGAPSPVPTSPTSTYWDGPSRPPSAPASRAPSMSGGVSGGRVNGHGHITVVPPPPAVHVPLGRERRASKASDILPSTPLSHKKAGSVHSEKDGKEGGGGHKFTLKDLLGSGPKLNRKSSQRSTSSRRSDSDAGSNYGGTGSGHGGTKSVGGDSAVSLTQKYGVCQKVAIGKGATSVVRLAHKWDRTEEKLYAIKEFRKRRKNESEKEYVKKLTAEFCISSTLHHPNIVETVDLVQDENQHWCEVMEFCPGGDLYAAIKKGSAGQGYDALWFSDGMSPSEVECCFKQILNGVAYLHSQGVAHRDIKPENLFFDTKGHLKIGDYGASTVYRLPWEATVHMSTGLCGSEPYIAPEQFLGKPYDARLVDIWACGIVYYCLHFQELPWRAAQPASDPLYSAYATACASTNTAVSACPPTINNLNPRACRSLMRRMLEPDPRQRATIEEIVAHAWIQTIEVCHEVEEAKHVHVSARAMGMTYLGVGGGGNGNGV